MMGLGVRRHLAAGPVKRNPRFKSLDDRLALSRARFLHPLGPEQDAHVLGHAKIADIAVVAAEFCSETLKKGPVRRSIEFFKVVVANEDAFAQLWRHAQLLAGLAEGLRRDRDFLLHAGAGP